MENPPTNTHQGATHLVDFARQYGPADVDYGGADVTQLGGDAGFRRYFRLSSSPSLMMVDSPPEKEKNLEYVRINDFLAHHGIPVPHMHAVSFEQGLFVLEDLGDRLLLGELKGDNAAALYDQALNHLFNMQSIDVLPTWAEQYSAEKLYEEMQLFTDWFLTRLLGIPLDQRVRSLTQSLFDRLVNSALEQPQAFVHRDFHSRNLMLAPSGRPGQPDSLVVIDFQDAVWGPITYDLVSLCRDCYVRWDQARVTATVKAYGERLMSAGLITRQQCAEFPAWADLMGLQRHIKVLGIFARLYLRDDKPRYLDDLPLVLRYTLDVLARYQEYLECAEFYAWMLDQVIPIASGQNWYKDWKTAGHQLDF